MGHPVKSPQFMRPRGEHKTVCNYLRVFKFEMAKLALEDFPGRLGG
jgi:hypothetical protein